MMTVPKIFFTSDQHFYHANIIRYCKRPFSSVDEMNSEMLKRHNDTVSPGDIVYHLGDFALAHRAVEVFLPKMNGIHHLIAGNHDHVHPVHYKKNEDKMKRMLDLYLAAGFKTIDLRGTITIAGRKVLLNHMPYSPPPDVEGFDTRYLDWRPKDSGQWLLHGHIHEKWKQNGRMINVGVDVWNFTPVALETIAALINQGPIDNNVNQPIG